MPDPVALKRRLTQSAHGFEFFQAMRLFECARADLPRIGQSLRPADDAIRLGQDPEFHFAATEVAAYRPANDRRPARLAVSFLGLLGPNGPMPLWLTEYVRDRVRHGRDTTLVGFLDMFQHRMLGLFYRAWAASQPVISLDRPDDASFSRYVGSLGGFGASPRRERDIVPDSARLDFTGLLAGRTRHASGLASLLSQYFGLPVAIEQFVGHWVRLPVHECTRLGTHGMGAKKLGQGVVLGGKVWDRQHKFRVVIGPVGADDCRRLQPGSDSFRRLVQWVRLYTGGVLDWDLLLTLAPGAAAGVRLGTNARIARSTWLGRPDAPGRKPTLRFHPSCNA
ncbi:type VI secretion protein [Burkholderia ubonensis]|uniref:type VI secretion system baseplate subunit TssG n=1 Tax=Burkholderia ubonensis TaxID=101571 RepID=UPI00075A9B79|nr:type VI secretion system baseplate subunit TssG [Burkholderia ubonensis]KVO90350.1 type VI secretion protein [Burkholderia ubonensis]KVR25628.1 type VI secretion protein [Burkholderia ubonensis]KVU56162.1 type VI secretion protein [Burkholderia ubonensis]KWD10420.1 type VI secretion protein [Burkholderia ubonensis]KWD22517.1 type VI secretion protein [Burkholderia ubonensis]